ncbi:MAG: TIGR04255 family protein [Ktedonobacteraceae bacterium]
MTEHYKNSPISEAVCEFQFGQDSYWDFTVPGLVYEQVRDTFPNRSQIARVTMGISASEGEIGPQFGAVPIMRFTRKDEKAHIQVATHLLSIHHLSPYSSWQEFLPLIKDAFEAYCEVAPPKSVHRIGLRYINTIELTGSNISLEDFFEFRPYIGSDLPRNIGPFAMSVQLPFENSRDTLNLQMVSQAGLSFDNATIILDLDYFLVKSGEVKLDEVFAWIDTAHTNIESIFEASITEQLKQKFRG